MHIQTELFFQLFQGDPQMTEYTDREAYEIGVLQKQYINWILLVYVIAFFIPYATWVAEIAVTYFVYTHISHMTH